MQTTYVYRTCCEKKYIFLHLKKMKKLSFKKFKLLSKAKQVLGPATGRYLKFKADVDKFCNR